MISTSQVASPASREVGVPAAKQPVQALVPRVSEAAAMRAERAAEPADKELQHSNALSEINGVLALARVGLQFEFDKEADKLIARVVDTETGELIRQMPSEEALRVSKVLGRLQGLLIHEQG
jgi:flagellar protein FlaG